MSNILYVEITDEDLNVRNGVKDGNEWEIREQEAWLHIVGRKYPQEFILRLDKDQPAYPVGKYEIDLKRSITTDRYGALQLNPSLQRQVKPVSVASSK